MEDKPWLTHQLCRILNLMNKDDVHNSIWDKIVGFLQDESLSIYSWQNYHLWLILARHKIHCKDLVRFAVKAVEKNDDTKRPEIASMLIYLSTVDKGYRRVILRKFQERFTHGYFQNRLSLISLRSFDPSLININNLHDSLKSSLRTLHNHKDKDLVYVPFLGDGLLQLFIPHQIYSL